MIFAILLAGVAVYVILYYRWVQKFPPGPVPLPLVGNLYHLSAETVHEYVDKAGKDYGHCLTLFLPRPVVFFTDFATVKEALVTKGDHFIGRSHLPPEIYLHEIPQTGVVMSDGDVWKEQRRVSLKIMREHGMGKNIMEAQVNRAIDEMLAHIESINGENTAIDMTLPLQLCFGNVITETLFGYHFNHTDLAVFEFALEAVIQFIQSMRDNIWVLLVQAWPWTKHLPIVGRKGYNEPIASISKFRHFVQEEIRKIDSSFIRSQEPTNFAQSYLLEMEKNPQLNLQHLHAIVVDFWIGGVETSSTTMAWAVLAFMEYPEIQEKMRSELLSIVGRERRIEMADKPSLPYFNAAITELQRWANILPFTQFHRCTTNSIIGGKLVPKDTLTMPQLYSVMKNERIFPDPNEFKPERFLEEDGKTASKKHLEHFMAFGLGKRQCLGESLVRMELFLVIGNLLLNYRFEKSGPVDLTPVFGSVIFPRKHKCRVVPI